FSVADHFVGRFVSGEMPLPFGPRQPGQSASAAGEEECNHRGTENPEKTKQIMEADKRDDHCMANPGLMSLCLCGAFALLRERWLHLDRLATAVNDPQQKLPVRRRVGDIDRGLDHFDEHAVLARLQFDLEAMPVQADAVAVLLE